MHKWEIGELVCNIKVIFSNHPTLEKFANFYNIPFVYEPLTKETRDKHFKQLKCVMKDFSVDSLVLARYMQILPEDLCKTYENNIINIHHGFLPSFAGAKPYHQAYQKGVKMIGATSHYVTKDLDAGPIIEQDVLRVSHQQSVKDLRYVGKDIERLVLTRAVKNHLEDRVLTQSNKTIILQ